MMLAPSWLQDVRAAMAKREWNQAELTRRCGFASESDVSRMFTQGAASTRVVSAVAEALEISDPVEQLLSEDVQLWVYAGVRMKEREPQRFEEFLMTFTQFLQKADQLDGLKDPPRRKK
jgi:hypothetical protein